MFFFPSYNHVTIIWWWSTGCSHVVVVLEPLRDYDPSAGFRCFLLPPIWLKKKVAGHPNMWEKTMLVSFNCFPWSILKPMILIPSSPGMSRSDARRILLQHHETSLRLLGRAMAQTGLRFLEDLDDYPSKDTTGCWRPLIGTHSQSEGKLGCF